MSRFFLLIACCAQTAFAALPAPSPGETRSPLTFNPARFGFLYGGGATSDKTGLDFSWGQMTLSDRSGYRLTQIDQGDFPR